MLKEQADTQYGKINSNYPNADYYSIIKYSQPTDSSLIDLYNNNNLDEFYSILDTLYSKHNIIKGSDPDRIPLGSTNIFYLEIEEDSTPASILILDRDKQLLNIVLNQLLYKGANTFYLEYDEMFEKTGSGWYHFLAKVGSEERLLKFMILR